MLQKIKSEQLLTGMYVHQLHCSWLNHPFVKNQFLLESVQDIRKVWAAKIEEVTIDTSKGRGLPDSGAGSREVSVDESREINKNETPDGPAKPGRRPVAETAITDDVMRFERARSLVSKASSIVTDIFNDIRAGKAVDMNAASAVCGGISTALERDQHTLLGVARLKTRDEYTFQHSVSVAALMTAFARHLEYSPQEVEKITIGGLLHDIGKAMTPLDILNKPAKLTDEEFVIMRQHAIDERNELLAGQGLAQESLDVITQHHERPDGKGYPLGLSGQRLSRIGRMAAIVDIYDALTSVRCYKDAWEPKVALQRMMSWTPNQIDRELLLHFIKMLGVYPVSSVVELESGNLAIVLTQGEDLLRPRVRIIYNIRQRAYVTIREIDLANEKNDAIKAVANPADYKISVAEFL